MEVRYTYLASEWVDVASPQRGGAYRGSVVTVSVSAALTRSAAAGGEEQRLHRLRLDGQGHYAHGWLRALRRGQQRLRHDQGLLHRAQEARAHPAQGRAVWVAGVRSSVSGRGCGCPTHSRRHGQQCRRDSWTAYSDAAR